MGRKHSYTSVECFCRLGTRGICEMVSDGGGRFIPAHAVGVHTLSLLLSSQVAHDRATEDNHTQERDKELTRNAHDTWNEDFWY